MPVSVYISATREQLQIFSLCSSRYPHFSFLPQTPVIAVVGNDACWSQISREQVPILGSNVACGLAFTGTFSA